MTDVNSVSNRNSLSEMVSTQTGSTKASTPSANIDKEGFLKLLVAQLQNQDPLEPLSNEEYVSQLTSFSSLEQLQNISGQLEGLGSLSDISDLLSLGLALQQTNVNASAVGLIGKEVEAVSSTVRLGGDETPDVVFDLPDTGSDSVTIKLTNASGTSLKEISFDPDSPPEGITVANGRVTVNVEKILEGDDSIPAGDATISVTSTYGSNTTTLETFIMGLVNGIDFSDEATLLTVDGTPINIAYVTAVNNPS